MQRIIEKMKNEMVSEHETNELMDYSRFSDADKYAAKLTKKMEQFEDIKYKDEKLIKAMVLVEKDVFSESVKNIVEQSIDIEKIVNLVNIANDCNIDIVKTRELIEEEIDFINKKLADYFIENIPLAKRKTDAQNMRELMDNLDITKLQSIQEEPVVAEKWYTKIFNKIKNIFK